MYTHFNRWYLCIVFEVELNYNMQYGVFSADVGTRMTVRSCDVWRMIVKEDGRSTADVWGTKVHFKVVYQVWKCRWSSTSVEALSYSHASSDICWENTILHIVMIIQFNFENITQIPSVKVCIHFWWTLYLIIAFIIIYYSLQFINQHACVIETSLKTMDISFSLPFLIPLDLVGSFDTFSYPGYLRPSWLVF
jgi:hypothetical protein